MTAIKSNMLWVPYGELTDINKIKNALTVRSKYSDVPPIKTYREDDEYFGIPRNYAALECEDKTVLGQPASIDFQGQLRQTQEHIVWQWEKFFEQGLTDWLINVSTGAGKTVLALHIAAKLKVPFLVIVPTEDLMGQWATRITQFTNIPNGKIGYAQQTRCESEGKVATVGIIHSLCKDRYPENFKNHFGLVIFDECHKVPADTFSEVAGLYPAKYRLGLSATLSRSDGRIDAMYFHLGRNIIQSKESTQPKPAVGIYKYDGHSGQLPYWCKTKIQKRAWTISNLASNRKRNEVIAYFANRLIEKGLRTLVVGERIHQLQEIIDILHYKYEQPNIGLYISDTHKGKKKWLLDQADCIMATTKMVEVGIDKDSLRGLVYATPLSDPRQLVGRIRRINDSVPDPIVIDIIDTHYPQCKYWAKSRMKIYENEGFKVGEISG